MSGEKSYKRKQDIRGKVHENAATCIWKYHILRNEGLTCTSDENP